MVLSNKQKKTHWNLTSHIADRKTRFEFYREQIKRMNYMFNFKEGMENPFELKHLY